jgi:hypothetical protein
MRSDAPICNDGPSFGHDQMTFPNLELTMRRRDFITVLIGAATGLNLAAPSRTDAAEKMSKPEAEYQDSPKDIRVCATCTLFEPPHACKVVEGDISPSGWCKAFALAD